MPIFSADVSSAFTKLCKTQLAAAQYATLVPGVAVAVVHAGDEPRFFLSGNETPGGRALSEHTIFQLASLSKPISSTIVAAQVGRGEVAWSARVRDLLPHYPLANPEITVESLLGHRSGLPDHAGDLLEDTGYDRPAILERLARLPLMPPDPSKKDRFTSSYAYTNFGFSLGAFAACKGRDWASTAKTELTQLGMTETCVSYEELMNAPARAILHQRNPRPLEGADLFPSRPEWIPSERNADHQAPAGGISSSLTDLATWMRIHVEAHSSPDNSFRAALRRTHEPYFPGATYGLGWNTSAPGTRIPRIAHSGAFNLGAATCVMIVPSEQIGIVVLTNGSPLGVPEALCLSFLFELKIADRDGLPEEFFPLFNAVAGKMQQQLYPKPEIDPKPPANPKPPREPLTNYQAQYTHPFYGPINVRADGARLRMVMATADVALDHRDGDIFTYIPPGENGGVIRAVTFGGPPDRVATLQNNHLFEPYPIDEPQRIAPAKGSIRKYSFIAKQAVPVQLIVRRPDTGEITAAGPIIVATQGPNEVFPGDLPVEPGDRIDLSQTLDAVTVEFAWGLRGPTVAARGESNLPEMRGQRSMDNLPGYIFAYHADLVTKSEDKAWNRLMLEKKRAGEDKIPDRVIEMMAETDPDDLHGLRPPTEEVADLLKHGESEFRRRVCDRVFRDNPDLKLNLCPKCKGLTATPRAKQCYHCHFDWH